MSCAGQDLHPGHLPAFPPGGGAALDRATRPDFAFSGGPAFSFGLPIKLGVPVHADWFHSGARFQRPLKWSLLAKSRPDFIACPFWSAYCHSGLE